MRLRSYARNNAARPSNIPADRGWWYTHESLRTTRGSFRKLIRQNHLFTWLDPKLQAQALTDERWPGPRPHSREAPTEPSRSCSVNTADCPQNTPGGPLNGCWTV